MGHSLNDLSALKDEVLEEGAMQSLDDLKETGTYLPMLQPGVYTFRIPENIADVPWDVLTAEGQPDRVSVHFDDNHPLIITAAPPNAVARIGEPFTTFVNNRPRDRKFGGETVKINDFQYLLKKLGEKAVPKTNREYLLALTKYGGRELRTAVNVSWSCNPKRDVRMWIPTDPQDPTKGERREVAGQKGCEARYYPDGKVAGLAQPYPVKGPDGLYPEEIGCYKCRALLRGFANLDLIREA